MRICTKVFRLDFHATPRFHVTSPEIPQEIITVKSQHWFLNFLHKAVLALKAMHNDQTILLAISSEVFQAHPYSSMFIRMSPFSLFDLRKPIHIR